MINPNFEPLDDEEKELINSVERGECRLLSQAETDEYLNKPKSKNISIRVQVSDLESIRLRAENAGMPYQTLINSILHRYVIGDLVFKTNV